MKTPDEIKKALRLCDAVCCTLDCPYFRSTSANCVKKLHKNAIAYIKQLEAKARASVIHHAEPKNHVLTLEELKNHAGFLWNENRYDSFESEGEPAYAENDFLYVGDGNVDLKLNISKTYGRHWRCWLRKPTEAERRETPWAGDNHE